MRLLIFILTLSCFNLFSQDVDLIIEKYLDACGGRENLESLTTADKDVYFYNLYGKVDTIHTQSIEMKPMYRFSRVYKMDGELQFETFQNLKKTVIAIYAPAPSVYSKEISGTLADFSNMLWIHTAQELMYRQKKKEFKKVEMEIMDGKSVYSMESKLDDPKLKKTYYFDAANGLLVATKIADLPHNVIYYSDYRSVENVQFPFLVETRMDNRSIGKEVFKSIDVNMPIEVAYFEYSKTVIPPKRKPESRFNKIEWVQNASSINTVQELISQFKGKRILIDIWATWCGPCKAEFGKYKDPFYSFLEKNDINMLFLSVDKPWKEEEWKKDVEFYNVNGYHMLTTKNLYLDIQKNIIKGETFYIPRYVLISEDGEILDGNLIRPSQPEFQAKVLSLVLNN